MAGISFHEVTKRFGDVVAVDDLTLDIEDRELLVLLGPSGCGKSTALRMIAGLDEPTSGTVSIGEEVVNGVDPGDRDIAMVFQSYALYPHMTVFKNIEAPLLSRHVSVDGGTPADDVDPFKRLPDELFHRPHQPSRVVGDTLEHRSDHVRPVRPQ